MLLRSILDQVAIVAFATASMATPLLQPGSVWSGANGGISAGLHLQKRVNEPLGPSTGNRNTVPKRIPPGITVGGHETHPLYKGGTREQNRDEFLALTQESLSPEAIPGASGFKGPPVLWHEDSSGGSSLQVIKSTEQLKNVADALHGAGKRKMDFTVNGPGGKGRILITVHLAKFYNGGTHTPGASVASRLAQFMDRIKSPSGLV